MYSTRCLLISSTQNDSDQKCLSHLLLLQRKFPFNSGGNAIKSNLSCFLFRYEKNLVEARDLGVRKGLINGASMGIVWLIVFCAYALGFWYGTKLTLEDDYSIGNMIIVSAVQIFRSLINFKNGVIGLVF